MAKGMGWGRCEGALKDILRIFIEAGGEKAHKGGSAGTWKDDGQFCQSPDPPTALRSDSRLPDRLPGRGMGGLKQNLNSGPPSPKQPPGLQVGMGDTECYERDFEAAFLTTPYPSLTRAGRDGRHGVLREGL